MDAHNVRGSRRVLREYMVITENDAEVTWMSYTTITEITCCKLINMLLTRMVVAGDGCRRRAPAVSVMTGIGSSAGVVWGTDGLVVGTGFLPLPVATMVNAQICGLSECDSSRCDYRLSIDVPVTRRLRSCIIRYIMLSLALLYFENFDTSMTRKAVQFTG